MKRSVILGLCLAATFAVGGVAAGSASARNPLWVTSCHKVSPANKGKGGWNDDKCTEQSGGGLEEGEYSVLLLAGEKQNFDSVGGVVVFKTTNAEIKCTTSAGTGELIGGEPGTAKTMITFKGCTVVRPAACEVTDTSTKKFGEIRFNLNGELAYETKNAALMEREPVVFVFKTLTNANKLIVEFEFKGVCAIGPRKLEATGGKGFGAIEGISAVACQLPKAEMGVISHVLDCVEKKQNEFFYNPETAKASAGMTFGTETAEWIGESEVMLTSKELWLIFP